LRQTDYGSESGSYCSENSNCRIGLMCWRGRCEPLSGSSQVGSERNVVQPRSGQENDSCSSNEHCRNGLICWRSLCLPP
jgi:hypothetical protein